MTTVKLETISDEYGLFNVDSLSCADERLNCYITQDQYSSIIIKINQRMKKFRSPMNLPGVIGLVIIVLVGIKFVILQVTLRSDDDPYRYLITGSILIFIIGFMTACCAACDSFSGEKKEKRFKKLQNDIQKIADEEFMTIYQIAYSKWTIQKIGNKAEGKRFKLTAEFRRQQQRPIPVAISSAHTPIHWTSIRLDAPTSALALDLEQVMTSLDNGQHSQYDIAPSTPPPPSYPKVVLLFSQAAFSDCSNCGFQKCVFNSRYCTQCGHSLLIQNV